MKTITINKHSVIVNNLDPVVINNNINGLLSLKDMGKDTPGYENERASLENTIELLAYIYNELVSLPEDTKHAEIAQANQEAAKAVLPQDGYIEYEFTLTDGTKRYEMVSKTNLIAEVWQFKKMHHAVNANPVKIKRAV